VTERGPAVDKREALLDAAERAILAEGYAGASTRRIALEAGVPLSLLHYHFGGKEGLLLALVERARDRNRATARAQVSAGARAATALEVTRRTFLDESTTARLLIELAGAASHSPSLRRQVRSAG
jgi:AcrR family transcriptional regulator